VAIRVTFLKAKMTAKMAATDIQICNRFFYVQDNSITGAAAYYVLMAKN